MKGPTADEKRQQISSAAVKIFARKGYHGTRIADIAQEAGISYGLVYHYFRSKEEIVTYLFQEKWDLLVGVIESIRADQPDIRRQVHGITSFLIESYRVNPDLIEALVMEITRNADFVRGRNVELLSRALVAMEEIVRAAQERGEVRASADPRLAAYGYFGMIEAVITGLVFKTLSPDEPGEPGFERLKEQTADLFLGGITPA